MSTTISNLTNYLKRAQNRYLVNANNMANSSTDGFKKALVIEKRQLAKTYVDPTPGDYRFTDSSLDLALTGDGYFTINTRNGIRFTRAGNFSLNEKRQLVTAQGETVLDKAGKEIVINDRPSFGEDGSVYSGENMIGFLAIVKPINPSAVSSRGGNLLEFAPEFASNKDFSLKSGYLEGANINPVKMMTDSIEIMRTFDLAQRVLKINQTLSEKCATEIGNTQR